MKVAMLSIALTLFAAATATHVSGNVAPPTRALDAENERMNGLNEMDGFDPSNFDLGGTNYRALRGLNDEAIGMEDYGADLDENDELVVAGGAAVRGGAVAVPPIRRRRGFY
ncbi:hypothetical protein BBJ28_00001625 [Nothophytophthora sp. Chile5]|nr:hypothetical protein BBJ28_00001625 [Nothophytophthora sp. Chile5]